MDLNELKALFAGVDWISLAALSALGLLGVRNLDVLKPLLDKAKALVPANLFSSAPDRTQAFAAVQLLLTHFDKEGCKEGVEAAKEAGRCLFHSPGDH